MIGETALSLPLAGVIDFEQERERLSKEAGKLQAEALRNFTLHIVLKTLPNQPRGYNVNDQPRYGEDRGYDPRADAASRREAAGRWME